MTSSQWTTLRFFISSTFRDMQAERAILVERLFPDLRARLRGEPVDLIDIDLRWGVTADEARDERLVAVCRHEIDRARPGFIGILGHRHGSTLADGSRSLTEVEFEHGLLWRDLPEVVADPEFFRRTVEAGPRSSRPEEELFDSCYAWDEPAKAWRLRTEAGEDELELMRALIARHPAFRRQDSIVMLRSEALTDCLARRSKHPFRESDPARAARVAALRARVQDSGAHVFTYDTLEDFETILRDHVDSLIRARTGLGAGSSGLVPEASAPGADIGDEQARQRWFAEDRSRGFEGRTGAVAQVRSFLAAVTGPRILAVSGETGIGKSSLLARLALDLEGVPVPSRVVTCFAGASAQTSAPAGLLYHLLDTLEGQAVLRETSDVSRLRDRVEEALVRASNREKWVIIIDSLDQFQTGGASDLLDWLPTALPDGVRMVVSALPGPALEALRSLGTDLALVTLEALGPDERERIVRRFLARFGKRFPSPAEEARFLSRPATANPLYLLSALEELRRVARFDDLGESIDSLPPTTPELFERALVALEERHGVAAVRVVLVSLAVSPSGLRESDLRELLAVPLDGTLEGSPTLVLAEVLLSLGPYLVRRRESLHFHHDQFRMAVERRYLPDAAAERRWGIWLAEHLERRAAAKDLQAIEDLPTLALRLADPGLLRRCLGSVESLYDRLQVAGPTTVSRLAASLDEAATLEPGLRPWSDWVRGARHLLVRFPPSGAQLLQAAFAAGNSPVIREAVEAWLARSGAATSWLRPLGLDDGRTSEALLQIDGPVSFAEALAPLEEPGTFASIHGDGVIHAWDSRTGERLRRFTVGDDGACSICSLGSGRVAVGGHRIAVWNLRSRRMLRVLAEEARQPRLLSHVKPDASGRLVAVRSDEIRVWDDPFDGAGRAISIDTGRKAISACALTQAGRHVLVIAYTTILCIDLQDGVVAWTLDTGRQENEAVAVLDDATFVTGAYKGDVTLRSLANGEKTGMLTGNGGATVNALAVSGGHVVAGTDRGQIVSWRQDRRAALRVARVAEGRFTALSTLPDGSLAAADVDGKIRVLPPSWPTREVDMEQQRGGTVKGLAFAPDGSSVLAAGSYFRRGEDGRLAHPVTVWDSRTGRRVSDLQGHPTDVSAVLVHPERPGVLTAGEEGRILDWSASDWTCRSEIPCQPVLEAALMGIGYVVVHGRTPRIQIIDLGEGRVVHEFDTGVEHVITLDGLDFERFVTGDTRGTVEVRDRHGKVLMSDSAHRGSTYAVAASRRAPFFASGGDDGRIVLWDATRLVRIQTIRAARRGISALAWADDGETPRLVAGDWGGFVHVWNPATGERTHLASVGGNAHCIAFRGSVVAVGLWEDERVRLLRMEG